MKRVCGLLVGGLLVGCQAPWPDGVPVAAAIVSPIRPVVLTGRALVPGLRIQATSADLIGNAAVTLMDATGTVRAAGLTDAGGAFTLYQSTERFEAVVGAYYTLELSKRYGPPGDTRLLSMRTIVRREAHNWTSITGPSIAINPTTTAVAKLVAEGGATPAQVMATVSGVAFDDLLPFGAYTADYLASRVAAVIDLLAVDADPGSVTDTVWRGDVCMVCDDDLSKYVHLTKIEGDFIIDGTTLTAINLPNLKLVTGTLQVANNASLTTIAMRQLTAIGDGLVISANASLTDLDGFGELASINTQLVITGNGTLQQAAAQAFSDRFPDTPVRNASSNGT